MRNIFLALVFIGLTSTAFSQNYLDKIARESCDCLGRIPDTLDSESFNLQFGLCVLEASSPYSKELKRDHGINMKNIDKDAEALGTLIGLQMYSVCPDAFLKFNKFKSESDPLPVTPEKRIDIIQGKVIAVDEDQFVSLSLQDENGKIARFFWMKFIQLEPEFVHNYKLLLGKQLQLVYTTENFFDPRIKEYRDFNIIERLDILP